MSDGIAYPFQSVVVEIVQDWQAGFIVALNAKEKTRDRITSAAKWFHDWPVRLRGCQVVAGCILRCSSSRRCFSRWSVRSWRPIRSRTIRSHLVAASLSKKLIFCQQFTKPQLTRSVASSKVTFSARGPDEANVSARDSLLDEFILLWRLERDGVHAVTAADVSGVQPVDFEAAGRLVLPAEEVGMGHAARVSVGGVSDAVGAGPGIRQGQSSLGQRHCRQCQHRKNRSHRVFGTEIENQIELS